MIYIKVLPRSKVKDIISKQTPVDYKWALISICSCPEQQLIGPKEEKDLKKLSCDKILNLYFGDYDKINVKSIKGTDKEKYLFNKSHAKEIVEFVKSFYRNIMFSSCTSTIIVHCDAGISRSGAVGLWACRYLECDEKEFHHINSQVKPNSLIYETLYEVSGMKDDYKALWESFSTEKDI